MNGYRILGDLAVGGMAEILRGESAAGLPVVIKRMLPQLAERSDYVDMFRHEATLCSTLNHPGVVRCLEFDDQADLPTAVYEFASGVGLDQLHDNLLAKGQRLDIQGAAAVVSRIAAALDHIHGARDEKGPLSIVHRDICPANVLVAGDSITIVDFGIAVSRDFRGTDSVKGRIAYMAPEQAKGKLVDPRADVFSLGVILFELVTGSRMYGTTAPLKILAMLSEGVHPRARDVWASCPTDLDQLIAEATHPNPDQRITSAREFRNRLPG